MSLRIYIPQPPLSQFVHMLWFWEGYHPPHTKERILPSGMMELVINLADEPLWFYYPEDNFQPHSFYGPVVAGARTKFFMVDTSRPASILSVLFKPGAALPFFNVSARTLHNLHVPLQMLWGQQADDLYYRLLEVKSVRQRFHMLETSLLARLAHAPLMHRAVDLALAVFNDTPNTQTIAQIVGQVALSPTRFIDVFHEEIGLTPKRYCRVQRFQQALRIIATNTFTSFTDVALTCGYYDQAHFINEFQTFTGITPTLYFPQSREHFSNLPVTDQG